MKKIIIPAILFATVFGALALVASAHTSSTSTSTDTDIPITPDPDPTPRSATRDELVALLQRYMRESRTGGGRPAPVTRNYSTTSAASRKDAWFFRLTPDQQVWFVIFLYEQYDLSHGQISKIVPLSARAISRILRDAGAVRYSVHPTTLGNTLAA